MSCSAAMARLWRVVIAHLTGHDKVGAVNSLFDEIFGA
jgi:hypothetical protein